MLRKGKDIFVISCYCNTKEKIEYLHQNIKIIKQFNIPIAISSHYLVPNSIYELVDYFIYDKNNILSTNWSMSHWYKKAGIKINYESPYKVPYHGAAVYTNLKNAVDILVNKYDVVHFLEGDSMGDYGMYLKVIYGILQSGKKLIGFPFSSSETGRITGITTNIFTADIKLLKSCLPKVESWNEYSEFGGTCYLLENLLYGKIVENGFYDLISFLPFRFRRIIKFQDRATVIPSSVHFVICETTTNNLVLFVINLTSEQETYKITLQNNNTICRSIYMNDCHYYILNKSPKKVTCSTKFFSYDFNIDENSIFPGNQFEISDNSLTCLYEYAGT